MQKFLAFLAPLAPKILAMKPCVVYPGPVFNANEVKPLNPLKVPKTTPALQMVTLVVQLWKSNIT